MQVDRARLIKYLKGRPELLKALELLGPRGQVDDAKAKKLQEVAGFCEVILRYVRGFLANGEPVRILECSCGKSYLGLVLCVLLGEFEGRKGILTGVDVNQKLVEKCRQVAREIGYEEATYLRSRTVKFESDREFDLVAALHACDTATDEAIAKGIQLGAHLVMCVPCCQNQIRGQIKKGHPLQGVTEYGPARYRLANLLTDVLRAQFLRSAGYHVEMDEIASPRVTPKNLCICARKVKRPGRRRRDLRYLELRDMFQVNPKVEKFCPGVVQERAGTGVESSDTDT